MNISDEAVEAAARAYRDQQSEMGYPAWDALPEWVREMRLNHMRAALEAAAPSLMDQAWDEGMEFCANRGFSDSANPYRAAGAGE